MDKVKRRYIEMTYQMLSEGGYENVSLRKVASAVQCNIATLYKYFDNLDYLIAIASVRFLEPYYNALRALAQKIPNPLDLNLQGWECFAFYAFQEVPIFENLFIRNPELGTKAMQEYFEEFPEDISNMQNYLAEAVSLADLRTRDHTLLQQAVERGIILAESVEYLVDCDIYILTGMFQTYRDTYRDEGVARKAAKEFMDLLYRNYERELLPGHQLLTAGFMDRNLRVDRSDV